MTNAIRLVGLALIAIALFGGKAKDAPPTVAAWSPSAQAAAAVAPIRTLLAGQPVTAEALGGYYAAAATDLRTAPKLADGTLLVPTTGQLRVFLERSITIRFAGKLTPVPGLGAAIHGPDGALAKLVGLEAKQLDAAQAADALDAIAWACRQN